jgi:hypothetical protein
MIGMALIFCISTVGLILASINWNRTESNTHTLKFIQGSTATTTSLSRTENAVSNSSIASHMTITDGAGVTSTKWQIASGSTHDYLSVDQTYLSTSDAGRTTTQIAGRVTLTWIGGVTPTIDTLGIVINDVLLPRQSVVQVTGIYKIDSGDERREGFCIPTALIPGTPTPSPSSSIPNSNTGNMYVSLVNTGDTQVGNTLSTVTLQFSFFTQYLLPLM